MKFIFQIKIRPGHTPDEYVAAWESGSRIIQRKPGARGTRLHRTIGDPSTLLAIAEWDSKEARDKAMIELGASDEATRAILGKPLEYGELFMIGEYDDPEWTVLP